MIFCYLQSKKILTNRVATVGRGKFHSRYYASEFMSGFAISAVHNFFSNW